MDSNGLRRYWRDLLIVLGLFAASRAFYAWLGVRFDASPFPRYLQFIDERLLTTRLLESLWYYHSNPPFLNLFVGVGKKVFGTGADFFFSAGFHLLGAVVAGAVFLLTAKLSASRTTAFIVTGVLVFSPAFVLYENWLMYSFPAASLLTIAAFALYEYVETRATKWALGFFGLLAALLLTRSLFHLAWLVMVIAALVMILWDRRRQVLLAAAVPLLVVTLWYAKNYYLFGVFSSSTLMGLGLSNVTTLTVEKPKLTPLVQSGELSPFALISRYRQTERLFDSRNLPPTGIPVLDEVRKSCGEYNYNSLQMIEIDRIYTRDGFTVIRKFPWSYLGGLAISNRLFFSPTQMNLYFDGANRDAVWPMEQVFNPVLFGASRHDGSLANPHFGFGGGGDLEVNTGVTLVVVWWVVLGYGFVQARRAFRNSSASEQARAVVLAFFSFTALYVYVVGTVLELAENYRYRFLVEPLLFVATATAITHLLRIRAGRRATSPAGTESLAAARTRR